MQRTMVGVGAVVAFLAWALPAHACGYGVRSPLERFNAAEWVVVGKVTHYEDRTVKALPYPGAKEEQEFALAELEVGTSIKGADGLTHIRIGLNLAQTLPVGKEACYFLNPHFEEAFCVMPGRFGVPILRENNPGFDKEVREFQRWGRLLKDPMTGLTSDDADERFLTAALLINQYRTFRPGFHAQSAKTEEIDAKQSKLILMALAEADWSKASFDNTVTAQGLFFQLGASEKDGWQPHRDQDAKGFEIAAKNWLKEHAETFRVTTFVAA